MISAGIGAMFRRHRIGVHAALVLLALITFYPFLFLLVNSFKSAAQFYRSIWWFEFPLHPRNYAQAWAAVAPYIGNSVRVALATVTLTVTLSLFSGYAFARFEFPGKNTLYYGILVLLMIPAFLVIVPLFMQVRRFGLIDTHWSLILPYSSGFQAFAVLIMRGFFASLPRELFEAARIDGASEFLILRRIVVPLSRAVVGTVALFIGLQVWNDYVFPLIMVSERTKRTIPVGLMAFRGEYAALENWGGLFAGYIIASVPMVLLFLVTMRYFMRGLLAGAVKT